MENQEISRNYEEAWTAAIDEIKKEYYESGKKDEFTLWIEPIKYVSDTINTINVCVGSAFLRTMMNSKGYFDIVLKKIKKLTCQENLQIECSISENSVEYSKNEDEKSEQKDSFENLENENNDEFSDSKDSENEEIEHHPQLRKEFTFDSFVPGDSSMFAYKASIDVAKNPGKMRERNPLLLYGGSGLGKTHLMQSIGNYIYSHGGKNLKIFYASAETFTNEFIASLNSKAANAFKNKYRNLDVLLLDDIHFLKGKERIQEEFFYTFNALSDKNAQMVFTCDRPLREIGDMVERLVSRLSNGLPIDLQPPDYETRCAILMKKAQIKKISVDNEIIDYIAKNVSSNVRDLEAAFNRVIGVAEITGEKLNLELAKKHLKDIITASNPTNISLDTIQKVVAENYNITVSELKGKKRDKKYVIPRQIAIYIAREITEISYMELGSEFGGKDHSTIMHAYEKISTTLKTDSSLDVKIQDLIRQIRENKK